MTEEKAWKKRIAFLLVMVVLTGCGSSAGEGMGTGKQPETGSTAGLETAPILDYEVPTLLPGVLLSQRGYSPASQKIVVVCGTDLPESFTIVDTVTGESVYTGSIEMQGYEVSLGEYIGYGDFSLFAAEGEYYVECDILGRSYSFVIDSLLHEELLAEGFDILAKQQESLTQENLTEVCGSLSLLLLSYELYGSVYDSRTEQGGTPAVITQARRYADRLLSWQDADTGAVMSGGAAMPEQTAWVSAALAKFSYTYQKFDSVYATACLQAADRAWKYLDKQKKESEDASLQATLFFAAAELYRAAGKYEYHATVKELGQNLMPEADDKAIFFGTLTYAATKRNVDVELCGSLLGVLLDEAESIAEKAKDSVFMTGSSLTGESLSAVLWDAVVMAAIDYVITNSEYASVLEHYQSYLGGTNEKAYCCVYGREEDAWAQGIGASSVDTAGYIMMLSEIMSHEEE